MPNWAEGNIRLRGKRDNLINFLKNELCRVFSTYDNHDLVVPIIVEDFGEGWYLILKAPEKPKEKYTLRSNFYFRNSNRQFIFTDEDEITVHVTEGPNRNKDSIIFIDDFHGAWAVDDEIFRQYAMKYKIDIRIFCWECGNEWSEVATYFKTGTVSNDYRTYDDWLWESPLPHYGG